MVEIISDAKLDEIKRRSAYTLPDNPGASGMKPNEIKKAFWAPIVSNFGSIYTEINRIVGEINSEIEGIYSELAKDVEMTLNSKNNILTLSLYNDEGEVLKKIDLDLKVYTNRIDDRAVTTDKLALYAVTESKIADDAVTGPKIVPSAITTEKVADAAITPDKIADEAIGSDKIEDSAVKNSHISDGAVTTEKISDGGVTMAKLAIGSVTGDKLSAALINRLLTLESGAFTKISYDDSKGVLTFTCIDGSTQTVNFPLEQYLTDGDYDDTEGNEAIVLVLNNGKEIRIPISDFVTKIFAYVDGVREKMFDLQEAPPISALSDSLLLTTPTLAQLAGLS